MKAYTDIEQSKKLAEILPLESADMYYFLDPTPAGNIYHLTVQRVDVGIKNLPHYDEGDVPCWSLTALFNLCPTINEKQPILTRGKLTRLWYCYYEDEMDTQTYDNPVDACVEMILKLKEQNLL